MYRNVFITLFCVVIFGLFLYYFAPEHSTDSVRSKYPETYATSSPAVHPTSSASTTPHATTTYTTSKPDTNRLTTPAPKPTAPMGATWHANGGLMRINCEAIEEQIISKKCTDEKAIANYIYSIVPGAVITLGFCFPNTSFDNPKNWNACTDLSEFKTKTVHALQGIFLTIINHCTSRGINDCNIIITGGSEFGHKGEMVQADNTHACIDEDSHCGGKKIDLRLTQGLESLVTTTFDRIENRDFDNANQWQDPESGNIYAREIDHWDILVP